MTPPQPRPILMVEDNETHHEAMRRAFRQVGCTQPLFRCADGDEALDYLYRRGKYPNSGAAPRPAIILLDLNLPGTPGQEVLADIKADDDLCTIPVIVVSSLVDPAEVRRCYRMGANTFIRKGNNFEETLDTARRLNEYWIQASEVPVEA